MTDRLNFSEEPNALKLKLRDIDIKPFAQMRGGLIESGIIVKFGQYNLKDVLIQMLDDYGIEKLVENINELRTESEPEINFNK